MTVEQFITDLDQSGRSGAQTRRQDQGYGLGTLGLGVPNNLAGPAWSLSVSLSVRNTTEPQELLTTK